MVELAKELEELLTVREFSRRLKIEECTTRKWLLLRKIRSYRVGGKLVRIPVGEVTRLISEIPARQNK